MVTVLNRFPGAVVLKEVENENQLGHYLQHHPADFIIINESLFNIVTSLYLSDSSLLERTIILMQNEKAQTPPDEVRESIYYSENKEDIIRKISNLINNDFHEKNEAIPFEITMRERTIVRLVSMGLTNRQIAERLFLSTHTVITHRKNIIGKLGIKSVSGLTVYAIVNNNITIDEVTATTAQ